MSATAAAPGVRHAVKRLAERALRGSGLPRLAAARRRGDVLVLAYHNIVPEGEWATGDLSLHLPQREFARQLDLLARTHDVVPIDEVLTPGSGDRPRVALTFDDAYRGTVAAGVAELVRRGLPGTIFVAPAYVDGGTFWWDELGASAEGLDARTREHALHALAGSGSRVRAWAAGEGIATGSLPPHQAVASEAELRDAASKPGITLGSHTWSHPNLAALRADELREELVRPIAWLEERFPRAVRWLTYPYGLSSPEVQRAARDAGYRGGFRVDGGWMADRHADPFALPRLNVAAGLSLDGFLLRVSGLLVRS